MAIKRKYDTEKSKRITVSLSQECLSVIEEVRPEDGSLADGLRSIINIAVRTDDIEHQNRELVSALTMAMREMARTLEEIRRQVARLEQAHS
jgi:hypothetical protein